MKYQIEKAVADIGVKVVFGSVEGVDNTGRNPEWEAERKVRLKNLQKHYDGLDIHRDAVFEGYFDGKKCIDFGSGIGTNSFGFCNKEWISAVTAQLKRCSTLPIFIIRSLTLF